jgi:DNA-directed RNA polymerase subunit RPC12/RpoP
MESVGINSIAEIVLLRVTARCSICGSEWGFKSYSVEELLSDIQEQKKLVCFHCKFGRLEKESEGGNNGYKEK